jgi:hypothetical protein
MFKPCRIRLIITNLITNLITTRLMLGIHRCHFPSAGVEAGVVEAGAEAGVVEVGMVAGLLEAGTAAGTAEIIRQLSLYRLSAASQLVGDFTQWQERPINLQKGADGVWVHFMVGGGLVEVKM